MENEPYDPYNDPATSIVRSEDVSSAPLAEPLIPMGETERRIWESSNHDLSRFYEKMVDLYAARLSLASNLPNEEQARELAQYKLENAVGLGLEQGADPEAITKSLIKGLRLGRGAAELILERMIPQPGERTVFVGDGGGHTTNESLPRQFQIGHGIPHIPPGSSG